MIDTAIVAVFLFIVLMGLGYAAFLYYGGKYGWITWEDDHYGFAEWPDDEFYEEKKRELLK
jgi:hypothetical protein